MMPVEAVSTLDVLASVGVISFIMGYIAYLWINRKDL